MHEESIGRFKRKPVPELLDRPFSRGVGGSVPVQDPPRRDVEDHEHLQPLERRGDDDTEVAGEDCARMVVEERGPRLRRPAGPRQHSKPELRPPAPLGLDAPEEAIEFAMSAYERVGVDNGQHSPPRDDARQQCEGNASGVVGPLGPSLPFDVAGELLPQEEVFGARRLRDRSVARDSRRRSTSRASVVRSTCGDDSSLWESVSTRRR